MITGKIKEDVRIGPRLYLRGETVTLDNDFACCFVIEQTITPKPIPIDEKIKDKQIKRGRPRKHRSK